MNKVEQYKYECKWNPKKDITTYELACCIPYTFSKLHDIKDWDKLDKSITRHFTVTKFDYRNLINNTAKQLKGFLK